MNDKDKVYRPMNDWPWTEHMNELRVARPQEITEYLIKFFRFYRENMAIAHFYFPNINFKKTIKRELYTFSEFLCKTSQCRVIYD